MYWLLKSLEWGIGMFPLRFAVRAGQWLGWIAGSVVRFRRREVQQTLATCFPDRTKAEIRTIARDMYLHLGAGTTELFWYCRRGPKSLRPKMIYSEEQSAILDGLKAQNKGVLILTAHLGNFELFGTFAALLGYPATAVVKPIKNAGVQRFWAEQREALMFDVIPWRSSFRDCVKRLRKNEVIAMIMDQNQTRSRGVFVDFFDRSASTSPGLAVLASQTGAPVLPAFIVQRPNFNHELVTYPVIDPPPDNSPESIHAFTQQYTAVIEDMVRKYPEQWIWLHRRWRTQAKADTPDMEISDDH